MSEPTRIAERYHVHELLGRGGMASVYRVTDSLNGRQFALKQLLAARAAQSESVVALFEREFHTLRELSHPRVITVYDYGVAADGPYYTMELLDGGDLLARAPVPWRELCGLLFDVCSSLALLHSRRLLHRDINPRNIRCTQDGKAKLIDFGAMATMSSGGAQVVGTPAFTPPETLHRLATDARADLFSLGTTFYAALTGELAYPARTFAEVITAWQTRPAPPSARVPDVPPALDELILSLISLDPALRPKSAFDLMQRLAAIAGLSGAESIEVSRAYLSTPALVGRDDVLDELRAAIGQACDAHGGGVILRGGPGLGRSRLLDACAVTAMTRGALVLRATASGNPTRFAVLRALLEDVLDALPDESIPGGFSELFESPRVLRDLAQAPAELQQAASRFLLAVSRVQPLVLAVDDVERIDSESAAVLAALLDQAPRTRVLVVMTAESTAQNFRLDVLARRSRQLQLRPLDRDESQQLLASLFGDVARLGLVAQEIHAVAAGNPRTTLDLAQHLVDRGTVRYAAGSWTLPDRIAADDLPRSAEAAQQARVAQLSREARSLAQAQALAFYELFSPADYQALALNLEPARVDQAISELLSAGALIYDGSRYRLAHRIWTAALQSSLHPDAARERHAALAALYHSRDATFATVHHAFLAGLNELGLAALQSRYAEYEKGVDHKRALADNLSKLVPSYRTAVRVAHELGRAPREINELRRWAVSASVSAEDDCYTEHARPWFAQLERDSGLDLWRADAGNPDAGDRLTKALIAAQARLTATPEAERVYTIEEAIRRLAEFVVVSIAIAARALNHGLTATLAPILEPFAPLSPMLTAIWNNASASYEGNGQCRYERARERWIGALATLDSVSPDQAPHAAAVQSAIVYAIGMTAVNIGLPFDEKLAERLEADPYQRLSALSLRKIARLQQGDWGGAERLRREHEIAALQLNAPPMFNALVLNEFTAYYRANDLTGMKAAIDRLQLLAARYPTWDIYLTEAKARFERARGDLRAARFAFESSIQRAAPDAAGATPCLAVWISANAGLAETLLEAGEIEAARCGAAEALAVCDARGVESYAYDLVRVLALCEAKLGNGARACELLDPLIRKQTELGVTGLHLGLSTEARARVAIWLDDRQAFDHYASLTAREYRHGADSPLGARFERLLQEATRHGIQTAIQLSDFATSTMLGDATTLLHDVHGAVLRAMQGAQTPEDRAGRALRLLCEAHGAGAGHLFLRTNGAFTLRASHPGAAAPEALRRVAQEYMLEQQSKTDVISDIATGELEEEESSLRIAEVEGVRYELLLLSCAVAGTGRMAGVAAITEGTESAHPSQLILLSSLATHLVKSGDLEH
jgi:Protein kinase domain/AAA ATPase domain